MPKLDCVELLKQHEGFRSRIYQCPAGAMTIGYGHNLDALPIGTAEATALGWPKNWATKGITKEQAHKLLLIDIAVHAGELERVLPWVTVKLDEVRRAVLINMAFNLGVPRLYKFKRTLQALERGNFRCAAKYMLESKWAKQVGKRAHVLAGMMATGNWPG